MSPKEPGLVDSGLLDDFFSEADEHMIGIRKGFVSLEESVGKAQPNPRVVEDLFRHFHSLKGISAIVGLASAESVAHATEEFLRLLKGGKVQLTQAGLDTLVSAIQKLEQIVAAFRSGDSTPSHEALLKNMREQCALSADEGASGSGAETNTPSIAPVMSVIEGAKARGLQIWKYTFTPTQELNAAGVNVDQIRESILKIGEIIKSMPQVRGPGLIAFDFMVAARDTPTDLASWESKGVTIELQEDSEHASQSQPDMIVIEEEAHNPFFTPSHVVRVDLQKLDELMRITGEMVIHRSRLDVQLSRLTKEHVDLRHVQEVSIGLSRALKDLRQAIMRVRLVPVAEIFARMPFVIKDLARQSKKLVRLKLEGQETAVDKYLIEKLKDPLLHLVRNAFSHGVETAEERVKASKPPEATITLSASAQGDLIVIKVRDDGRGIDRNAILAKARKLGFEIPSTVDNEAILKIICASGFSTRENADHASGRGVGMAVVHSTVREMGGAMTLQTSEGQGTEFSLRLPLTLAIAETLVFAAAGQVCAIPQSFVVELKQVTEDSVQIANGVEVVAYRSGLLPVIRLEDMFGLKKPDCNEMTMLVISSERGSVGLFVERMIGQREVVVRALRDPLIQVPGVSAATELGDGKLVLILDGAALTRGNVRPPQYFSVDAGEQLT